MRPHILAYQGFDEIMKIFDTIPAQIQDANIIIQVSNMPKYKLKNKEIEKLRTEFKVGVYEDQQQN